MEVESESEHNMIAEAIKALRAHASTLLSEGVGAKELSFAMSFVATELGMQMLATPISAVPVVVSGMASAAQARARREESAKLDRDGSDDALLGPPSGVSLH